jgi:hypothetical protein
LGENQEFSSNHILQVRNLEWAALVIDGWHASEWMAER